MSDLSKSYLLLGEIRRRADEHFDQPEPFFRISHDGLLQRARETPPAQKDRRPVVTAFADWVYDLDHHPFGRSPNILWALRQAENYRRRATFELGTNAEPEMVEELIRKLKVQDAEREVQRKALQKHSMAGYVAKAYKKVGWEIIYNGTSTSNEPAKTIKRLTINKEPLKAKPDLVLRDGETGEMLVIELKTWRGGKQLPRYGWANLKAQLWCYGLLEWAERPPKVFLQAHVWLRQAGELTGKFWTLTPWQSDDPRIHRESLQLFEAFGGAHGERPAP